jgi:ABC-type taurine transport system ATPase subunit
MLTRLIVRNFKRFDEVDIELGNPVVFIGPNNSGKTTALQALALWDVGLRRWNERRGGKQTPGKRPGVTINRSSDLIVVPVPSANLLWRDLHVRDVQQTGGKQQTQNVCIDVIVEGVSNDHAWQCGLEFDYANEESFYCRPLRQGETRMLIPEQAGEQRIAFLPPMSGLAAVEPKVEPGRINVLIGEGQTAQVLRNLCHQLAEERPDDWERVKEHIRALFRVELDRPQRIAERGEIRMAYREQSGVRLDISAEGRGLHQTLLLLAYIYSNPGSVLLLDEPDAHLEIVRQRQIYQLLTQTAQEQGSQVIIASHSEVVLGEAANRDMVIAFVGRKPHRIDDRGSQVRKALAEIGFDQYYQAEQAGWVLYLEGSTDLSILQTFARRLDHPAAAYLDRPFVYYVLNQPSKAHDHFYGLREAKPDMVGIAIYDRLDVDLQPRPGLVEIMWQRREIENYLSYPETLLAYAAAFVGELPGPLFARAEAEKRRAIMQQCIEYYLMAAARQDRSYRWWTKGKSSDEFLDPLFEAYFARLGLENLLRKTNYHVLADLVPQELIDPEITQKLDEIVSVAQRARPVE